jgi:hypothetical protein
MDVARLGRITTHAQAVAHSVSEHRAVYAMQVAELVQPVPIEEEGKLLFAFLTGESDLDN